MASCLGTANPLPDSPQKLALWAPSEKDAQNSKDTILTNFKSEQNTF